VHVRPLALPEFLLFFLLLELAISLYTLKILSYLTSEMAITEAHPRIKAEVRVDGVALQEYDDDGESTQPDAVTKYIEASSGATFDICFQITRSWPSTSVLFFIYLGGKYSRGNFTQQKDYRGTSYEHVIEGSQHTKNGQWFVSKFAFSVLNIGMMNNSTA
jgi:hypothetical protein